MVTYIKDKDLIFHVMEYDVILVGTTINNSLGNGFQKEVARSFRKVAIANKGTIYGDKNKYGDILVVKGEPTFCLCYIYSARTNPSTRPDVLNYDALYRCLVKVDEKFAGKRVATTFIGTSKFDGGGDREKVREILEAALTHVDAYIYDYDQENFRDKDKEEFEEIVNKYREGSITYDEYLELKKQYVWRQYMGYYERMPDMSYAELKGFIKRQIQDERYNYEEGAFE